MWRVDDSSASPLGGKMESLWKASRILYELLFHSAGTLEGTVISGIARFSWRQGRAGLMAVDAVIVQTILTF